MASVLLKDNKIMNKIFSVIVGLIVLGGIAFSLWLFFQSLLKADAGITAAIIGAIAIIAVGIWSNYSTKLLDINSRHFIEKKSAYMHLINLIFVLFFKATKSNTTVTEDEILKFMFDFKRELMIWGDQAVINALETYENESARLVNEKNTSESLLIVDDLLRAIRKDLGHNDSKLKRGDLICMLIIQEDREKLCRIKL